MGFPGFVSKPWLADDEHGFYRGLFGPTADPGHKAMRFVFTLTGNVPKRV